MKPPSRFHHMHHQPRRPSVKARLAGLVGRTWARCGYAYHVEPTWLELNQISLQVRGLAPPFHGLKVAHLSDFHYGDHIPKGYLEEAFERTVSLKPDMIALTGDFIDRGPQHIHKAAKLFRRLDAPLGVFAVLGNHDFSVHTARGYRKHPELHKTVTKALMDVGIRVLRNHSVLLERNNSALIVAGVDDLWSLESNPSAALSNRCPKTPRIVLAHNPQSVELFGEHRADVVLSGHTHGGQINWPGLGRVLLGRKARRWAAGLYTHNGSQIYVNKGIGFGWRFRFGVRPEVAVFTLQPQPLRLP